MSRGAWTSSPPATWVELLRSRACARPDERAYTFLVGAEERESGLTYAALDRRARTIASQLQALEAARQTVVLLYPAGLEYIAAFLGCLYAGAIAVPLYPPRPNRGMLRLESVLNDSRATIVLTEGTLQDKISATVGAAFGPGSLTWIATDCLDEGAADEWNMPAIDGGSIAFLQYTSGSTAQPKGVIVSHAHLFHNTRMIQQAFHQTEETTLVGWLPLFHDMGLIGVVLQSLVVGAHCVLMAPEAFLMHPFRWLNAISRYRAHTSGGPNFAYELCVQRITPEQRAELDLSCWKVAFNGAEPVRHATLEKFAARFEPCGFRREALYPCYGLAEATLFVSGGDIAHVPRTVWVQNDSLEPGGRVVAGAATGTGRALVSCGRTWGSQQFAIVNPQTRRRCPPNAVGEIWVAGPNVTDGYWQRPSETEQTFRASLADTGEGPFLRTGDLGFLHDGELFITGRLKDLLICGGRNYYPEDIEQTLEQCHPAIRPGCCAAFSVDDNGAEQLIVAAEIDRHFRVTAERREALEYAIRRSVAQEHDVPVAAVCLLRHGRIPKTSSGKIQRHACRDGYLGGTLDLIGCADADEPVGRATSVVKQ
jgi:acyl-CoA synthetase (AMP-forming)/AMP-acid ligase II